LNLGYKSELKFYIHRERYGVWYIMSTYHTPHQIHRSIKAGASGYVIKDDTSRDLVPVVRTLHQGKRYFSQKIAELAKLYLEEQAK